LSLSTRYSRSIVSLIHEWTLIFVAIVSVSGFCCGALFLIRTDSSGFLFSARRVCGSLVGFCGLAIGSMVMLYLPDEAARWLREIAPISLRIAYLGVLITGIWFAVYGVIVSII